jgi:hypothetical protein
MDNVINSIQRAQKLIVTPSVLSRKYVDKVVSTLSGLNRQLPSK